MGWLAWAQAARNPAKIQYRGSRQTRNALNLKKHALERNRNLSTTCRSMSQPPGTEFWDDQPAPAPTVRRGISIKSLLVVTSVLAASAVCLGQLWRAAASDGNGMEIGQFVILTAAMPTLFLAGSSLFFRLFGHLFD